MFTVKPRPAPKQCTKYLAKAVASANAGQPVPPVDGKWETKFGIPQVCCGHHCPSYAHGLIGEIHSIGHCRQSSVVSSAVGYILAGEK